MCKKNYSILKNILNHIVNYVQIIQSSAFIDIYVHNTYLRIRVKFLQLLEHSINLSSCFDIAYIPHSIASHLFLLYKKAKIVGSYFFFLLFGKRIISLKWKRKEWF